MKNNKHIHDEDYDFSIKLMVPLLTILVCTICLCATTWAWYTASVSTGVTSITAKANVNVTVKNANGEDIDPTNGKYVLEPPAGQTVKYTLSFNPGEATNGYYALIDIENGDKSNSNTASILDLFVNRVYADDSKKVCVEVGEDKENQLVITTDVTKTVSVKYVWKVFDSQGNVIVDEEMKSYDYKNPKEKIEFIENSTNIITIYFVDSDNNPLSAEILNKEPYSGSLNQECAVTNIETREQEIVVQAPADYYLVPIDDESENIEQRKLSIDSIENNTLYIKCIEKSDESALEQIDNSVDTVQHTINITNTNDIQEEVKTDSSVAKSDDSNPSDLTNDKELSSGQESSTEGGADESSDILSTENKELSVDTTVDQPIESLLITDSADEGTTETTPSSDNTNSGTEEFTE